MLNQNGENYGITGEIFPIEPKDGVIIKNIILKTYATKPIQFFKTLDFKDMLVAMCNGIK